MWKALAVVPDQDLTTGNLYVSVEGREQPVQDLHPDDPGFARLDAQAVLRQHPGATTSRLQVKLRRDIWRPPARDLKSLGFNEPARREPRPLEAENARKSLDGFLGSRLPELRLPGQGSAASQKLTTWGWVSVIAAALNAIGLLFFPIANSDTLATLRTLGVEPTAMTRLVSGWWFSPLLGLLTAACLIRAFLRSSRRKFWIRVIHLLCRRSPGFAPALIEDSYSAYFSVLDNIK